MFKKFSISVIFILFLINPIYSQSVQRYAEIGNFNLENGQVIKSCKIGYRTFGKLNKEKSNALLFPTWFGGNTAGLINFIGPGKMADSTKYFVIAVDALGDGVSSSPSNSKLQPKGEFPKFNIRDMVNSQHILVTKVFKLKHLFCVIGGSMGGMQTFQWIVTYPHFMDKAVAWVGSPKLSFYDLLLWNTELQVINTDLKCGTPEINIMKSMADITELNIRTPGYYVTHNKPENFYTDIKKFRDSFAKGFNVYDWRSQLEAMIDHNVAAPFNDDMNKAAARVKAKLLSIVNLQDHMVNPIAAIKFAKLINAKTLELNNDCGHLGPDCEINKLNKTINNFLESR